MSAISNNDIARAIYLASKDKNQAEQFLLFPKIIQFLFRRRLLPRAPDILLQLKKIINFENKVVSATVWSAQKLEEKIEKDLIYFLKKRYSAKEVVFIPKIEEKLLGGFRVEINNEVIDLTLKNKIGKLEEHLISNHE